MKAREFVVAWRDLGSWLLLAGFLLLGAGCLPVNLGSRVHLGTVGETQAGGDFRELEVVNAAGGIRLEAASGRDFEIEAEIRILETREAEFVSAGELTFGDHIHVRSEGDRLFIEDAHRGEADSSDWEIFLTVRVPYPVGVRTTLGAGNIEVEVEQVHDFEVRLGAGEADLSVGRVDGGVKAEVTAGSCKLLIQSGAPKKDVTITCTTGDITLGLPAEFQGQFSAHAMVGSVSVASRYGLEIERGLTASSASGSVGSGGPSYTLQSTTGSIRLK